MDKAQKYSLLAAFMLLPLGFLAPGIIHEGQHLALVCAAVAVAGAYTLNRYIAFFSWYCCAWYIFILLYKMKFVMSMEIFNNSMDRFVYLLVALALFIAVRSSKIEKEKFYNFICIAALIQSGIAIMQSLGFDPIIWILSHFLTARHGLLSTAMTGTLGNNNFLSAFVAISLPFFFRRNWAYFIPLLAIILYFGKTTSAVIPALAGSLFYVHTEYKKLPFKYIAASTIAAFSIALLYAVYSHTPFYSNPRWADWYQALQIWSGHWFTFIFGMGLGNGWGKPYPMHNEWLECLYQFGIIGFGMMVAYVVTIYRGNRILFTAFFIAAFNMFGNYSLHLAPSAFLIVVIAGLIERESRQRLSDAGTSGAGVGPAPSARR